MAPLSLEGIFPLSPSKPLLLHSSAVHWKQHLSVPYLPLVRMGKVPQALPAHTAPAGFFTGSARLFLSNNPGSKQRKRLAQVACAESP